MKAIDVIKALLTNAYDMEQMGLYTYDGLEDIKQFFGGRDGGAFGSIICTLSYGDVFLYIYKTDNEDIKLCGNEPSAWFHAADGSDIALFKIHDA